jgi:hypothetical protein
VGRPGVNGIRVNLHSVIGRETLVETLKVTHGYEVDGILKEERVLLDEPKEYTIECSGEPNNVFIRMEVPSDVR